MCGFAGIRSFSSSTSFVRSELLDRMGTIIRHRGPDDAGTWISEDGRTGFAFRRLSIIDLSPAGHQPMTTEDGSLTIVFNGEIYNHQILRKELESAGYHYRSKSDTETLLHAYRHWGERFVERCQGMFAIALYDRDSGILRLYRDRLGVKPLYYTVRNGHLLFASEIKAILQHPLAEATVDRAALFHYFTFIHTPSPMTLFEGIRKMRPGCFLTVHPDGRLDETQFWDALPTRTSFPWSDEAAVSAEIRRLFREAVEKRMMSDVPFGVFLSGGIDSSANVAFMAELMDRPVDTFTVAIAGQEDTNEFRWAQEIARRYRTNHHEILIDDGGFLDLLPTIVFHQDEPLADPVCFPLYHVSKLARDNGTIVIQVGEGSDEQFAGYQSYLRALATVETWGWTASLPGLIRHPANALLRPLLRSRGKDYRQNIIRNLLSRQPVFWSNAIAWYDEEKELLLRNTAVRDPERASSYALVDAGMAPFRKAMPTDRLQHMIYWELKNRLAELLLMRVDKVTMATSIEARVPFLDHLLVEFSMSMPGALKHRGGVPKHVLKTALRGILPDEIIDRRKIGFAGSGKNMLTPEIFRHAKDLLLTSRHGYFDREYVRRLLEEYETTRVNFTPQIWTLYNFELWHRMWIEGRLSPPISATQENAA